MTYSKTMLDLEENLRIQMHALLQKATPEQRDMFRRMYNHKGIHLRDVDGVPSSKMDWAFMQIENGLAESAK